MSGQFYLRCCRLITRHLFATYRYPAIDANYVERHLRQFQSTRRAALTTTTTTGDAQRQLYDQEVAECKSMLVTKRTQVTTLLVVITILYALKNSVHCYLASKLYDYQDPNKSLGWTRAQQGQHGPPRPLADNQTAAVYLYSFACLRTNCSWLQRNNAANLGEDLSYLPVFSLCYPKFDRFLTPAAQLNGLALFIFFISVFLLGSFAVLPPILKSLRPARDETLLHIVAPNTMTRLMEREIRQLDEDLLLSRWNFEQNLPTKSYLLPWRKHHKSSLGASSSPAPVPGLRVTRLKSPPWLTSEQGQDGRRPIADKSWYFFPGPREAHGTGGTRQLLAVSECLPVIRSKWWHSRATRLYCLAFVLACLGLASQAFLVFSHVYNCLQSYKRRYKVYEREMRRQNCYIWPTSHDKPLLLQPIEFGNFDPEWHWYQVTETLVIHFVPALSAGAMLACYFLVICELSCWLHELRLYFVHLLAATSATAVDDDEHEELGDDDDGNNGNHPSSRRTLPSSARMWQLKQQTVDQFKVMDLGRKRHWTHLVNEKLEQQILLHGARDHISSSTRHQEELASRLLLMEKVYINFRLFLRFVNSSSSSATLLATMVYTFNYGSVLIAVYFTSRVKSMANEHTVLAAAAWFVSMVFIFLAANFHANTKKFQTLIWSLIARLDGKSDLRTQHMRNLWLKQANVLNSRRHGIALRAYKIRLTYVNIIQILVWTGTIVVIALKPQ